MTAPDPPASAAIARLARVRFVLVETSLAANIGAVARAMKTMGLRRLALVRPRQALDAEAIARASGADDLLAGATRHAALADALAGCRLVIGSSARPRSVQWPQVDPHGCARLLLDEAADGDVALLFGRERTGLTNDELGACHYLAQIPTDPRFGSLNIAAAAQVFAYELWRTALAAPTDRGSPNRADAASVPNPVPASSFDTGPPIVTSEPREAPLAGAEEMAGFYDHLARALVAIGYADPDQCDRLMRRLRRLFNRARPDRTELNILRGVLAAAEGRHARGPRPAPADAPEQ